MRVKNDRSNVGTAVIGLGRGMSHVRCLNSADGSELLAVCDSNKELAGKVAVEFSCDAYADYHEMLQRDDIGLVSLCTPSGTHCAIADEIAMAGKHVLLEKPIDIRLDRIDRTVKLFDEKGLQLGCIFQNRLEESSRMTKKAVDEGRLGRMTLATAQVKWYRDDKYYLASGGWRGTWAHDGGGSLMNQSVHTIDLMQWMMGPVKSVFGVTGIWAHEIESEDMGVALVKFESGAFGTIVGSTATYPGFGTTLDIHGTDGGICMKNNAITAWSLRDNEPCEEENVVKIFAEKAENIELRGINQKAITDETSFKQIQDMVCAVRDNRAPLIPGKEGRNSVEIILAIYRSAQTGKEVFLPL